MKTRIFILEDNQERRELMETRLLDRLPMFQIHFTATAIESLDVLRRYQHDIALISLDYDLDFILGAERKSFDPLDGSVVGDYLAETKPFCPVVVHSSNSQRAPGVVQQLRNQGWWVERVVPTDDMEWINTWWFHTVRDMLSKSLVETVDGKSEKILIAEAADKV